MIAFIRSIIEQIEFILIVFVRSAYSSFFLGQIEMNLINGGLEK